ncbi:c-type cytochrome biogenesis protein CcsB [Desulfatibacillum aliphaticivorans]|uniref:c-type cytochrome biogenesis protein CcsB n=1 Tax=Desulfatibacillum aliphaticivorans TaxID=218208 RepID=UPI0003FB1E3D|nr:c-type cytochrome biogenesis protein CcsB [Desulfatibacillum aliphaticivorans]
MALLEIVESTQIVSFITFVYGAAAVLYWADWVFEKPVLSRSATWLMLIGFLGNTAGIVLRWIESHQMGIGRAPFTNLYESLVFFAWTIAILYLVIEKQYKVRSLGAFAAPLAFLALAYAALQNKAIMPLMPALKSNWLIAHVITCFLGYAAFAVAFGLAVIYLIKSRDAGLSWLAGALAGIAATILTVIFTGYQTDSFWTLAGAGFFIGAGVALGAGFATSAVVNLVKKSDPEGKGRVNKMLPDLGVLDELTYQTILFGFMFLTAGIITGSVWANSAWGRYWSWDPKETWSLITWLIYGAMIHSRLVRGWRGRRTVYLSLFGFGAVLFTYFGVNTLLKGLHSYAT